jgi:hypothetical protein
MTGWRYQWETSGGIRVAYLNSCDLDILLLLRKHSEGLTHTNVAYLLGCPIYMLSQEWQSYVTSRFRKLVSIRAIEGHYASGRFRAEKLYTLTKWGNTVVTEIDSIPF